MALLKGFFKVGLASAALFLSPSVVLGFQLPTPKIETLPNGLKVARFLSDKLPVVDVSLLVRAGYREDPNGKSGVSELMAATLDRGAGGMTEKQIAHEIEKLGAARSAATGDDSFTMGLHGLSVDGQKLLELLSVLALSPEFREAEVKKEKSRLLDQWSHLADYSESLAALAYHRWISGDTPYGRGSLLSMKEFESISRDDLIAFHRLHFQPRNSILVLVGKWDEAKSKEWISKYFGNWVNQQETKSAPIKTYRSPLVPRPSDRGEVVVIDRPESSQAQVKIGWRIPGFDSPDRYPLVVGNAILGEYFNSRLNILIRDKLGLTYGIGSGITHALGLHTLAISASTRNEQVGNLLLRVRDVIGEMTAKGVTDGEVRQAKDFLKGSFALGNSTLGAVATRWMGGVLFDLGPNYLNEFVPKILSVQQAEVSAAFATKFDFDRAVVVIAGEAKLLLPILRSAGFKKVRVQKANQLM